MAVIALAVVGNLLGVVAGEAATDLVIGTVLGGAIGGMVGAVAGSYIDSNYLFPPQKQDPTGAMKSMAVTMGSDGSPGMKILGTIKIGGVVIWMSAIRKHVEDAS